MRDRGIMTDDDREFYTEEFDPDGDGRQVNDVRYRIRSRFDNLEKDLDIWREVGEDELLNEFHERFERASRVEDVLVEQQERIRELERKLERREEE